jgi:hypothetical protein
VLRLGWPVCCWCIGCADLCGLVAWVLQPCMPGSAVCTVACGLLGLFPCPVMSSSPGTLGGGACSIPKVPGSGISGPGGGRGLSPISPGLSLGDRLAGKSCPPPDLERHEPLLLLSILGVGWLLLLLAVGVSCPVYNYKLGLNDFTQVTLGGLCQKVLACPSSGFRACFPLRLQLLSMACPGLNRLPFLTPQKGGSRALGAFLCCKQPVYLGSQWLAIVVHLPVLPSGEGWLWFL